MTPSPSTGDMRNVPLAVCVAKGWLYKLASDPAARATMTRTSEMKVVAEALLIAVEALESIGGDQPDHQDYVHILSGRADNALAKIHPLSPND